MLKMSIFFFSLQNEGEQLQREIAALKTSNREKRKEAEECKRKYEQLKLIADQLKEMRDGLKEEIN